MGKPPSGGSPSLNNQLALAHGIAEGAGYLERMFVSRVAGEPVSMRDYRRISGKYLDLLFQWPDVTLPLTYEEIRRVTREARLFVAAHQENVNC